MVDLAGVTVSTLTVTAFTVPTDEPESDGTLTWDSTTIVVVRVSAAGYHGIGYTYAHRAAALVIDDVLKPLVVGADAMAVSAVWRAMVGAVRNLGRPGVGSMAIAAVDIALWDLKARLLGLPLARLLGAVRPSVPIYGSGGFTSYSPERLTEQLSGWVADGISHVKMKVGRDPARDVERAAQVRRAIGDGTELFVDANGAYDLKQALEKAEKFADLGVTWFEEPVSSDDLDGLRLLRDRAPAGMEIAAGEYGHDNHYFRRMLAAGAVDVLQADVTRCGGITGFLRVGALCDAFHIPLSAHTAPALHLHPCAAAPAVRNIEYFHDHVRIETMLFDGVAVPSAGALAIDDERPGLGLELKSEEARRFQVWP